MSWELVAEAAVHFLAFVLLVGFSVRMVLTPPRDSAEVEPLPAPEPSPLVVDVVERTLAERRNEALALLFLYAHTVAPARTDGFVVVSVLDMLREVFHHVTERQLDALPNLGPCFRQLADNTKLSAADVDVLLARIESTRPHDAWLLQRCAAMIRPELGLHDGTDPLEDQAWLCITVEAIVEDLSELLVLALIQTDRRKKVQKFRRVCARRSGSVCERLRSRADAWTDRMAPRQFPVQLVDVRRLAS